jgi:hypothetical protein
MIFWTGLSWLAVGGCFAILLSAIGRMLVQRHRANNVVGLDTFDGAADFSGTFRIEDYEPMERLLGEEDWAFLQSQPGYSPALGKQWKRERRRIFRLYFNELKLDFRRLHAAARALVAQADADSADLVTILMRQRWQFLQATAGLEVRLALAAAGIGKVDAAPLLALLDSMRMDLVRHGVPQAA